MKWLNHRNLWVCVHQRECRKTFGRMEKWGSQAGHRSVLGEDGHGVQGPAGAGARARSTEFWVQDRKCGAIAQGCLRKIGS